MNAEEPVNTQAKVLINVPYLFSICLPGLFGQIKVNNPLRVPKARGPRRIRPVPCWETRWMNSFWCLLCFFFSPLPACQLTYFLVIHQSHGERGGGEGGWRSEWEGEGKDGGRERMKSLFRHQKTVLGDREEYTDSSMCFLMMPLYFMNSMVHNSGSHVFSPLLLPLFLPSFPPKSLPNTRYCLSLEPAFCLCWTRSLASAGGRGSAIRLAFHSFLRVELFLRRRLRIPKSLNI